MQNNKMGSIGTYLPRALKFYDISRSSTAKTIFIMILASSFFNLLFEEQNIFTREMISVVFYLINGVATAFYSYCYLYDLKKRKAIETERSEFFSKKLIQIITILIIYYIAEQFIINIALVFPGIGFIFTIPAIIFSFMFMFTTFFILDKDIKAVNSFKLSKELTHGYKWRMFGIFVAFIGIVAIPLLIFVSIVYASGNNLIFLFVVSFIITIASFVQQRLLALMYVDLMYSSLDEE